MCSDLLKFFYLDSLHLQLLNFNYQLNYVSCSWEPITSNPITSNQFICNLINKQLCVFIYFLVYWQLPPAHNSYSNKLPPDQFSPDRFLSKSIIELFVHTKCIYTDEIETNFICKKMIQVGIDSVEISSGGNSE